MCLATQSETGISEVCMHHAFLCKMQVKRVDFCISQENKDDRLAESVSQSFFNPLKKKKKKKSSLISGTFQSIWTNMVYNEEQQLQNQFGMMLSMSLVLKYNTNSATHSNPTGV